MFGMADKCCAGDVVMQDTTLRPSVKDIDEELLHLVAEQTAANDMLAGQRQKDQALLEQMLPPQVTIHTACTMPWLCAKHPVWSCTEPVAPVHTHRLSLCLLVFACRPFRKL